MPRGDGTGPRGWGAGTGRGRGRCGDSPRRAGSLSSRIEMWKAIVGAALGITAAVIQLLSSRKANRPEKVIDVTPEKERLE